MLKYAVAALPGQLSELAGKDHKVYPIYTQEPTREFLTRIGGVSNNGSYLRTDSVELDPSRKPRRQALLGLDTDGKNYRKFRFVFVQVQFTWMIPLVGGIDKYFDYVPTFLDISQGRANFEIEARIGSTKLPVPVQISLPDSSLAMPILDGDVQENQIPLLEKTLVMSNVFVLFRDDERQIVPALQNLIPIFAATASVELSTTLGGQAG